MELNEASELIDNLRVLGQPELATWVVATAVIDTPDWVKFETLWDEAPDELWWRNQGG